MAFNSQFTTVSKFLRIKRHTQRRCGVIPYGIKNGQIYLCLAQDFDSGDYTDFGGSRRKGETILHAALRELREESAGLFSEREEKKLSEELCLFSNEMIILFINVDLFTRDWTLSTKKDIFSTISSSFQQLPLNRRQQAGTRSIDWISGKRILAQKIPLYVRVFGLIFMSTPAMIFLRQGLKE